MRNLILFIAIAAGLSSCKNLVPYTDAMKQNHNWTNEQVKAIQFYVSHDIILRRELTKGSSEIIQGKIKVVDGRKVDEVLIKAGTPGVVTEIPKDTKVKVSFEMGDDKTLSFGVNPNASEKYVLLAADWRNGQGKVHYGTDEYYTDPDAKFAFLMVDMHKVNDITLKQHVAKGRTVK